MTRFLDTNVLVYLFDRGAPAKQARARDLLDRYGTTGEAVISTQVLQEFFVSVTRKLARPLDAEMALDALRELTSLPTVQVDPAMVLAAASRSASAKLSFWDALVIESALTAGASVLFSEDLQHDGRYGKLRVQNPFV